MYVIGMNAPTTMCLAIWEKRKKKKEKKIYDVGEKEQKYPWCEWENENSVIDGCIHVYE